MNNKIRMRVNELFENMPNTKRINDLKDEIISNAEDKYEDYIKNGKTEDESYELVIKEIGDVDELVSQIQKDNPISKENYAESKRKTALVVATAVGMYVLSLVFAIVAEELGLPDYISGSSFLVLAGIATCMLIYYFMSRPDYSKYDDTMIEEFKEWKGKKDNDKEVRKAITSILWTLITIVYFFISFMFGIWYISWLIFIIGVLIDNIITLIFKLKTK